MQYSVQFDQRPATFLFEFAIRSDFLLEVNRQIFHSSDTEIIHQKKKTSLSSTFRKVLDVILIRLRLSDMFNTEINMVKTGQALFVQDLKLRWL